MSKKRPATTTISPTSPVESFPTKALIETDLSSFKWLLEVNSVELPENQIIYSFKTSNPIKRLKNTFKEWKDESSRVVALGRYYSLDWAQEDVVAKSFIKSYLESTPPSSQNTEFVRKRDLLIKYCLARRAGLINSMPDVCSSVESNKNSILDAINYLKKEADYQNEKNLSFLDELELRVGDKNSIHVDFQADLDYVKRQVNSCEQGSTLDYDLCHHCGVRVSITIDNKIEYLDHHLGPAPTCQKCGLRYCRSCLRKTYDQTLATMSRSNWICPKCEKKCWCASCVKLARCALLKRAFLS